tara:strand:- start:204 stop:668 length:465 start_codon:yes stop_codon:yes gene_type:complete
MKYLKEKFGKYFEFKNTINGTNYLLRGLLTILFAVPVGLLIGFGIVAFGADIPALGVILCLLGGLIIIPMVWFSLATTYKRINAIFPKQATLLTILTVVYSIFIEFFNPNKFDLNSTEVADPFSNPVYIVLTVISIIWSLYLLFVNSKVKKHIG